MPRVARLSPAAQRVLEGLLRGRSLEELAPSGDPARAEVEEYLTSGLGATRPTRALRVPRDRAVLYSDGASRGNPGPAAIGIRVLDPSGEELVAEGHRIGQATNNVAEYRGAIAALEKARELRLTEIELRMDSELVVKQIKGEYRVKEPTLADLKREVDRLLAGFRAWSVRHIPRAQNADTDQLANEALDET